MDAIILQGVRTHNLKNIDLVLPHKKFYCITGVSGSGKSSLAFDTLYAEGQRRFVESLSAYARQFLERMEKPDMEAVSGIPPAIAIESKNVITNARSTVGTQTEINDYLRVFFARIGETFCPECKTPVSESRPESVADALLKDFEEETATLLFEIKIAKKSKKYVKEFSAELEKQGFVEIEVAKNKLVVTADQLKLKSKSRKRLVDSLELAFRYGKGEILVRIGKKILNFSEDFRCITCQKRFRRPTPNLFSFNSPLGACGECQGFGRVITLDWNLVIPNENLSINGGVIEPWTKPSAEWEKKHLFEFCVRKKIPMHKPWKEMSEKHRNWILHGCEGDDYFSVDDFFKYLEKKTYKMHVRIFLSKYRAFVPCPKCRETRLKPEALYVKVKGKTIHELQCLSLSDLNIFIEKFKLNKAQEERVGPVFLEIQRRVRFLCEVGLGYISLSRLSRTLSGGEVQRIHLATSLGSALVDTLYVLDEPSIGLHERDNRLLIRLIRQLRDLGNTIVVVEHDRTMIEAADEVLDMGPSGGEGGGRLLFQGPVSKLNKATQSLTADYLLGKKQVTKRKQGKKKPSKWIRIKGAAEHNLKNIDVNIPLNQFVVLSGVSGSGKSTFLYDILYSHYQRHRGRPVQDIGEVKSIKGFEHLDEMVLIDQSPIGRTPRSNPATYLKAYDEIRKVFARLDKAKREGYEAGHFSFNVDGGRCPACKGDGRIKVEMHFLADVFMPCEACQGKRFKKEILEIRKDGKNIDDVLGLTIDEACEFFAGEKRLIEKLEILRRVGLSYLRLGQSATTLSGGEAQRLKLAKEMTEKSASHILYLFDEPTTGLHYHDIHYLMAAFEELLARGHSLMVIEHNMEVIGAADYVIDLGPDGGSKGGEVVFEGAISGLKKCSKSFTGKFLGPKRADLKLTSESCTL